MPPSAAGSSGGSGDSTRRQPERALQVEAVAAAPVRLEAAVAQPADGQRARRRRQPELERRLLVTRLDVARGRDRRAVAGGQQLVGRRRREPRPAHPQGPALELVLVDARRALARQAGAEAAPDPAHRLAQIGRLVELLEIGRAAQDEVLLGARRCDVEDAPLLLLGVELALRLESLEPLAVDGAAEPGEPQADAAVLRDPQGALVVAALLAEVADADDRELEPLGAMDGHHAHRVERLGLERRLALAGLERVELGERVDEAAQVAALVGLELARHPHQLAHVGHAPDAARQREQVAVVAGARHGAVDQRLERHLAGHAALGLEAMDEGRELAPVRVGQHGEQVVRRLADGPPGVAAACGGRAARSARPRRATGRRAASRAPSRPPGRRAGWRARTASDAGRRPAAARSSRGRPPRERGCRAPRVRARRSPWRSSRGTASRRRRTRRDRCG